MPETKDSIGVRYSQTITETHGKGEDQTHTVITVVTSGNVDRVAQVQDALIHQIADVERRSSRIQNPEHRTITRPTRVQD